MTAATSVAVKLRPEIVRRWKQEARCKYEKQFRIKWENDISGKCIRNPTRQQINEEIGLTEIKAIIQGEYYGDEDYFPPRKQKSSDFIKQNKKLLKQKPNINPSVPMKPRSNSGSKSKKKQILQTKSQKNTMYDSPMVMNHRRKADLCNQRQRTPDTVANSMFHPVPPSRIKEEVLSAVDMELNKESKSRSNTPTEPPPVFAKPKRVSKARCFQNKPDDQNQQQEHVNKEALFIPSKNTNLISSKSEKNDANHVRLNVEDIESDHDEPQTCKTELTDSSLAAVGSAVRNVKMLKGKDPKVNDGNIVTQNNATKHKEKSGQYNTYRISALNQLSTFHTEGTVRIANHTQRAHCEYGTQPWVAQRSAVYLDMPTRC